MFHFRSFWPCWCQMGSQDQLHLHQRWWLQKARNVSRLFQEMRQLRKLSYLDKDPWVCVMAVLRMIIFLFITCPSVLLATRVRETGCPLGHFPCGNMSECLPQVLQCNGHRDCPNGADERRCGESTHSHSGDTGRLSPHFSPLKLSENLTTVLRVMR